MASLYTLVTRLHRGLFRFSEYFLLLNRIQKLCRLCPEISEQPEHITSRMIRYCLMSPITCSIRTQVYTPMICLFLQYKRSVVQLLQLNRQDPSLFLVVCYGDHYIEQSIFRCRKRRGCLRDRATTISDITINRATFHIRFKCTLKGWNQCVKLISGQSSHRTSFHRMLVDWYLHNAFPSIPMKRACHINLDGF